MKGFSKFVVIFSIICFIIGIILCISGVIIGARFSDVFDRLDILDGKISYFGELSENDLTFSKTYTGVENIDLDVSYGSLYIINSNSDEFKVDILSNSANNSYSCYLENGTLYLKTKSKLKFSFGSEDMVIRLYVPEDYSLNKSQIEIGACDFYIDKIISNDLDINVGLGNLSIDSLNAKKCKIECGLGNIDIGVAEIKSSLDIECDLGSVSVKMFGDKNEFNYDIDCSLGNVNIGGQSYSSFSSNVNKQNNSDKDIKIDCGLGNVDISFIDE